MVVPWRYLHDAWRSTGKACTLSGAIQMNERSSMYKRPVRNTREQNIRTRNRLRSTIYCLTIHNSVYVCATSGMSSRELESSQNSLAHFLASNNCFKTRADSRMNSTGHDEKAKRALDCSWIPEALVVLMSLFALSLMAWFLIPIRCA